MSRAQTFRQLADELRDAREWSLERLALEAAQPDAGVSMSLVRKVLDGKRSPTMPVLAAVAGALGVPPTTFAEYRLAVARDLFDPRVVGLEAALAALERLPAELREAAG